MEIGPGNAKGARKAIARIEHIADDRHAVAAHMLEQLRRTMLAQRQHRSDLEAWIDRALHPMQLPAALERREKGAHALVAHGGAIRTMPLPLTVTRSSEVDPERAARLRLLPPPLWGRVGEGVARSRLTAMLTTPTPNPSPQGGGEHIAFAAPASQYHRNMLTAMATADN